MSDDPALRHFQQSRAKYFDALCRSLGLATGKTELGQGFATVYAEQGQVRVFFEHDRGLCFFGVGGLCDPNPLCTVEELASRFPRIRRIPEGVQRLSLEEQQQFIENKWQDLQVLFSSEHLPDTRKWRDAAAKAQTARFLKKP